ncbi:RING-type E3 ubiquitin-protein ligase PPIL2 [Cyclospora cayetanensis]|uniref:RING-type E3 ubiquitin transferase n=1 Tax=Cyclospora cayetanensis TaxID=88456 RepID=A0A6P6RYT2_9EIME|nr:RING-type E3 ubiquitin-protein ligase PPIL2 [Cyclospora cayetanensis]
MPKHKHHRDRLYLLQSEYSAEWGGFKKKNLHLPFKSLPFDCCGLSLRPFEDAVCTDSGIVFDASVILPYIKKYRRCPVTGAPLSASDLYPLVFHKNARGAFHCPVTFKEFGPNTHIVANKKSGHVYAADAIENLCRQPKLWNDLITGEPFTSADLVHIQNPTDAKQRCIEHFHHIREGQDVSRLAAAGGVAAEAGSLKPTVKTCETMEKVLAEAHARKAEVEAAHNQLVPNLHAVKDAGGLKGSTPSATDAQAAEGSATPSSQQAQPSKEASNEEEASRSDDATSETGKHHLYTDHRMAAGFTSTVVVGRTTQAYRQLSEREQMLPIYALCKQQKMKSYIRMETSAGALNLELYTHLTPRTTDSFLRHCISGYYEGTIFHRLIPNFMIQGGRAELRQQQRQQQQQQQQPFVSRSGFSNGQPFEDEILGQLSHQGIGVLAMANDGRRNKNVSEFYITFKSCTHLDGKHTIFGRVVGGLDVLRAWEGLPVDSRDRPQRPLVIEKMHIFKNAFDDAKKQIQQKKEKEANKEAEAEKEAARPWFNNKHALDETASHPERHSEKVGKYMRPPHAGASVAAAAGGKHALAAELMGSETAQYVTVPKKPKVARKGLDLSSWWGEECQGEKRLKHTLPVASNIGLCRCAFLSAFADCVCVVFKALPGMSSERTVAVHPLGNSATPGLKRGLKLIGYGRGHNYTNDR